MAPEYLVGFAPHILDRRCGRVDTRNWKARENAFPCNLVDLTVTHARVIALKVGIMIKKFGCD